jgi:hypothetical protein
VWVEKYLERPERDVQKLATMQLRERKSAKDNITDIEISRHSVDKVQTWLKQSIERSEPWDVSEVSIFYLFSLSLSLTSSELHGHRPLKGPTLSPLRVVNLQIKLSYGLAYLL